MDEILREVIGVFVIEVQEQAQNIATALLQCEAEPGAVRTHLEEVFRQAHSLKGSSASLGFTEIEQLAHALESALSGVRHTHKPLSRELVDAGLAAADAARARIGGLTADNDTGLQIVKEATERLLRLVDESPPKPAAVVAETNAATVSEEVMPAAVASEAQDFVRVPVRTIERLDRDAAELRVTSGRLTRYSAEAAKAQHLTEELWQLLRRNHETRTLERPPQLYQLMRVLQLLRRELASDAEQLTSATGRVEDELRTMRLVPAQLMLEPLQRAAREACRITGRQAQVQLVEAQVNLDRALLEELKNPLMHLVRNAVDHGIEAPEVRAKLGKPPRGTITVHLEQRGELLLISVSDDGRGIDPARVRTQAEARRLVTSAQADELDEAGLFALLFTPGFSTAQSVTELSGRGVGLDVVQRAVARLHGQVTATSQAGHGARFEMTLPLTVAASSMLLIKEGDHTVALPQASVAHIRLLPVAQLVRIGTRLILREGTETITVALLGPLLGLPIPQQLPPRLPLLVLRTSGAKVALLCSQILGEEELILRPLPPELRDHRLLSGVALSPSGIALCVLAPTFLQYEARSIKTELPPASPVLPAQSKPITKTILVADDSITTRTLLRSMLEVGGYNVRTAADGDEAIKLLVSEPVDLVVSDVRMPLVDGLALLTRMRTDARTVAIPLILFSSSDSEEDQRRGDNAGAAAYLSKNAFDRGQLFDVVARILGRAPQTIDAAK